MTKMLDLALDGNDDINTLSGDFICVESTYQHQRQLLLNGKGSFKQNPTICVGIYGYLDDEGLQNVLRAINIEFTRDGMKVASLALTPNGQINSNAYYP